MNLPTERSLNPQSHDMHLLAEAATKRTVVLLITKYNLLQEHRPLALRQTQATAHFTQHLDTLQNASWPENAYYA